jgi:hypothetical protein
MDESIESPHGDHVERTAAATAMTEAGATSSDVMGPS